MRLQGCMPPWHSSTTYLHDLFSTLQSIKPLYFDFWGENIYAINDNNIIMVVKNIL